MFDTCNKCGQSCIPEAAKQQGWTDVYGLQAQFSTGYCSPVLPDGHAYSFALCEACVADLMETFTIKPQTDCVWGFPCTCGQVE